MLSRLLIPAVAMMVFIQPVRAQETPEADGHDEICLTIARNWLGTAKERASIERQPVPQSFRSQIRAGGCARFQLMVTSLLDWHLRYGTAKSALTALRFLERELASTDAGADQLVFDRQFAAAENAIAQLYNDASDKDATASQANFLTRNQLRINALPEVKALRFTGNRLGGLEFIASEYIRAAEAFGSVELYRDARAADAAARTYRAALTKHSEVSPFGAVLVDSFAAHYVSYIQNPEMRGLRLVMLGATLAPTQQTIDRAAAFMVDVYGPTGYGYPDLFSFLKRANEGDDEACLPDELNSREGYRDRCQKNFFEKFAYTFWYDVTRLELLARRYSLSLARFDGPFNRFRDTGSTIDLFIRRDWASGRLRYGEDIIAQESEAAQLVVWDAEDKVRAWTSNCLDDGNENALFYQSLRRLIWAQSLVNPAIDPRTYRQIAAGYLKIHAKAVACNAAPTDTMFTRNLIVSRQFLANYRTLAANP
jgi:hypothetical protein